MSIGHIRNERELAGAFDRRLQLALVHRTRARDPARQNLAALGNERPEQLHILVIDVVNLIRAELADLAPPEHRPALACLLFLVFLVFVAAAAAARASLSKWHGLNLHPVKTIIIELFRVCRPA